MCRIVPDSQKMSKVHVDYHILCNVPSRKLYWQHFSQWQVVIRQLRHGFSLKMFPMMGKHGYENVFILKMQIRLLPVSDIRVEMCTFFRKSTVIISRER